MGSVGQKKERKERKERKDKLHNKYEIFVKTCTITTANWNLVSINDLR